MNHQGQGAVEYLLIMAAAILLVAIVLIAVTGAFVDNNFDEVANDICIESGFDGYQYDSWEGQRGCFIETCEFSGELKNCEIVYHKFDNLKELVLERQEQETKEPEATICFNKNE